jgi:hypothetical protein
VHLSRVLVLVYGLLTAAQEQQAGEVASNGSLLKVHDCFNVGLLPVVCIYHICWRSFMGSLLRLRSSKLVRLQAMAAC